MRSSSTWTHTRLHPDLESGCCRFGIILPCEKTSLEVVSEQGHLWRLADSDRHVASQVFASCNSPLWSRCLSHACASSRSHFSPASLIGWGPIEPVSLNLSNVLVPMPSNAAKVSRVSNSAGGASRLRSSSSSMSREEGSGVNGWCQPQVTPCAWVALGVEW